MRHALAFALCALLGAAGPATAQSAGPADYDPAMLRLSYGAFCKVQTDRRVPAPDTALGAIEIFTQTPDFLWLTNRVPAAEGISFGVKTEAVTGEVFRDVIIMLTHPPLAGSGITRQSYVTQLGGGGTGLNAYTFDLPEEMVPGQWVFEALHQGRRLYRVEFTVVPPGLAPQIAGGCGGQYIS
jgi:hypothetical protein